MEDIKVSIVASAVRVQFWEELYNSLLGNKLPFEVIFVGDKQPGYKLPSNFHYIYSPTKPAQCYEIGFRAAKGELVHWTADDSLYNHINHSSIDTAYNFYKTFNDEKVVVAMRPIEDGGDVYDFHHFFGGSHDTPIMAPLGLMSRKLLLELGGYDRRFISGQSENDLVMRVFEVGGRVEICMDAYLYLRHRKVHEVPNPFRQWYTADRRILEGSWVKPDNTISKTRLDPVDKFEDKDLLTVTQGLKGRWS